MAKQKSEPKSTAERIRTLPWAALLQGAIVVGERWRRLSEKDRARLTELLHESRGRLSNLSVKERNELRRLAGRLDVKGMARDIAPLVRGHRAGRKIRRRSS